MISSIDLFKYFYYAAKFESLSEAAKAMYTSQPVVSKYIHRLESELNVTLFTRTSRGVLLTEEGQLLYKHVKTAFNYLDAGTDALARQKDMNMGHIRIGVSTTLCKYLLLPDLQVFINEHPNIRISIQCQSSNQTMELLEQNKIDIGLVAKPEDMRHKTFFEVKEIEDVFVAAPSYLNHFSNQDLNYLFENATLLLLDHKNISRQFINRYIENNHIQPMNLLEISTMDLIIEFAKIGIGIGCVIKSFVEDELKKGTLVELPLNVPLHRRKVGFIIRDDDYKPHALNLFLQNIVSI